MKSTTLLFIGVALVIVLAIGAVAYGSRQDSGPAMQNDEASMMEKDGQEAMMADKDDAMMEKGGQEAMMAEKGDAMMEKKGAFMTYSPSEVARASADNRTVLFFNAGWCPSCRATTAALKSEGVPAGLTVLSVDYDTNVALRQQYGVTQQHTFVQVDATGKKIASWTGSDTGADIAAKAQ